MEYLSRKGVEFEAKDVRADPQALKELLQMRFSTTPVIVIDDQPIAGFDADAIDQALG